VGHVYLIKFNAWTYAKSNLWASLMQTIFVELNNQLTLERKLVGAGLDPRKGGEVWRALYDMSEEQRQAFLNDTLAGEVLQTYRRLENSQRLSDDQDLGDFLWHKLRELKDKKRKALHQTESQQADERRKLEELRMGLAVRIDSQIEQEARRETWRPFQNALQALSQASLQEFKRRVDDAALNTEGQAGDDPRRYDFGPTVGDLIKLVKSNPWELLAFVVFLSVTLLTPFVLERLAGLRVPGTVLGLFSIVLAAWRANERWRRILADSFAAYQQQLTNERAKLKASREQRLQAEIEKDTAEVQAAMDDEARLSGLKTVPALELKVQKLEAKAKRLRQQVGLTADTVSLADFVSSRLNEAFYENQLGLMHQVERDLRELTDGMLAHSNADQVKAQANPSESEQLLFPRGPARIVLFIDDLVGWSLSFATN
jgi:hypothetical protein